jgi:hypothetical protein
MVEVMIGSIAASGCPCDEDGAEAITATHTSAPTNKVTYVKHECGQIVMFVFTGGCQTRCC